MKTRFRLHVARSDLKSVSPLGLAARALLLIGIYAVCELIGLRENTTFLSGTQAASAWNSTVVLGLLYLFAYYGFILAAPILLLAAALLSAWDRLAPRRHG